MLGYIVRRLTHTLATMIGISVLVFCILHLAPGDPALMIGGDLATTAELKIIRQRYGLDRPLPVQYVDWAWRVLRGDLGLSVRSGEPVGPELVRAFRISLTLSIGALVIATTVGIPLGIIAAVRRGSVVDLGVMGLSVAGMSVPSFWVALLLILLFSLYLRLLPSSGWGTFRHAILPVASLSFTTLAILTRMTRATMIDVLLEDFVRTARAKGLADRMVLYKHALINAFPPVLTIVGLRFGLLAGGAVIHETIFAIPGAGRMVVQAVFVRDFPILQGGVMAIALFVSFISLIVDLMYTVVDPRIQYS